MISEAIFNRIKKVPTKLMVKNTSNMNISGLNADIIASIIIKTNRSAKLR
jgi:hypothetical protein